MFEDSVVKCTLKLKYLTYIILMYSIPKVKSIYVYRYFYSNIIKISTTEFAFKNILNFI